MRKGSNANNSYFPHDSNARNSDKLIKLRMRHKAAGYGVYFMILERLREEDGYMSVKDYNMIAFDLREDASLIKSVVEDFGLFVFTEDGKYFYSESFNRRMDIKDEKSRIRAEAGRKGSEKRWGNGKQMANAIANDSKTIANAIENDSKKSKEKKRISPPQSPTGGSGGGEIFFNLSGDDTPPSDGVQRNYEGLMRNLSLLQLPPDEYNRICELSNYGEIGNPVWKTFEDIRSSGGKITQPGKFILSRLRNTKAN